MEDFRTLKFLDKFKGLFVKFGVDYPAMRDILQVKLMMDRRRVPTIFNQQHKKQKKDENQFIKSLWMYGLFGLFLLPFIIAGENYLFQMSIVFGILVFFLMSSMISDFSSVLLDIRDKAILGTKPVNQKTVGAAKLIHVCIYMFFLSGSMTVIPLVVGLIRHGILFFVLFAVELILLDIFIIVLTAFVYILILKFFDGERLKDIINYVQIGLSFGIIIGYQLVVRSFEFIDLEIVFEPKWWHLFIMPLWFASPFELTLNSNFGTQIVIFSALAILVPIVAIMIYSRLLPTFERNLQKLANNTTVKKKSKLNLTKLVSQLVCISREERIFFQFANLMMTNEREFKLKVYPSIGFSFVIPFLFLIIDIREQSFAEIGETKKYLTMYFSAIIIPTVVMMLSYSGKYKGAWIYGTAPIQDKAAIFKGTLKAFLARFYIPIFLLLSIIFVVIFSVAIIPDLVAILLCAFLYTVICFIVLNGKTLPFSESISAIQQTNGVKVFLMFLVLGAFSGMHYLLLLFHPLLYVYIGILFIVNLLVWRFAFKKVG